MQSSRSNPPKPRHPARAAAALVLACAGLATVPAFGLTLNEIRTASLSGDADEAFFELAGSPGQSLDGLTYVVIGDSANSSTGTGGVIESVTSLAGLTIQSDGYFFGARAGFLLGTPDAELTFTFESNDNVTHLLVQGFTGSFGQDLDADDDGTIDTMPWTGIVDAVSIAHKSPGDTGFDHVYGTALGLSTVGPSGSTILRILRDPDATGPWIVGDAPFGEQDSPGEINTPVPEPMTGWQLLAGLAILPALVRLTRRR